MHAWCDPMIETIATLMDYDQIKLILADCGPIHDINANIAAIQHACAIEGISLPNYNCG